MIISLYILSLHINLSFETISNLSKKELQSGYQNIDNSQKLFLSGVVYTGWRCGGREERRGMMIIYLQSNYS